MTVAVTAVGREAGVAARRAPAAPAGAFASAVARAEQAPAAAPRAEASGAGKAKTLAASEAETQAPEAAPDKARKETSTDRPATAAKHKPQAAAPTAATPASLAPASLAPASVAPAPVAPPVPTAEPHEQGAEPTPGSSTDAGSHVVTAQIAAGAGASGSATANAGAAVGGENTPDTRGSTHAVLADAAPAAQAVDAASLSQPAGNASANAGATVATSPRSAGRTNAAPKPSDAKAEALPARPLEAGRAGASAAAAAALPANPGTGGAGSASSAGSLASAVAGVAAVAPSPALAQTASAAPAAASPAAGTPAAGTPALTGQAAAALAAAVTAMVQDGKNSLQIRLDPPELGSLSIHLAVGQDAKVNVLLLAAVPQTATVFAAGADDLRQAFAASGLALGQLNVGGESGAGRDDNRRQSTARPVQLLGDATNSAAVGVRAIA